MTTPKKTETKIRFVIGSPCYANLPKEGQLRTSANKETAARNLEADCTHPRNLDLRPAPLRDHVGHQRMGQAAENPSRPSGNILLAYFSLTPDPGQC